MPQHPRNSIMPIPFRFATSRFFRHCTHFLSPTRRIRNIHNNQRRSEMELIRHDRQTFQRLHSNTRFHLQTGEESAISVRKRSLSSRIVENSPARMFSSLIFFYGFLRVSPEFIVRIKNRDFPLPVQCRWISTAVAAPPAPTIVCLLPITSISLSFNACIKPIPSVICPVSTPFSLTMVVHRTGRVLQPVTVYPDIFPTTVLFGMETLASTIFIARKPPDRIPPACCCPPQTQDRRSRDQRWGKRFIVHSR